MHLKLYKAIKNTIHTEANKKLVSNQSWKVKLKWKSIHSTFRVESLLPLSRSLLSADQLQRNNFVKHEITESWKILLFLLETEKLTWSGRHLQHALWKLQQTFLWYRSTIWQIYQRRHLPTIAHQGKSTHDSQAANIITDENYCLFQYTIYKNKTKQSLNWYKVIILLLQIQSGSDSSRALTVKLTGRKVNILNSSTLRQQISKHVDNKMRNYTFWWPVIRALGCLLIVGSQRNIVKSSEPETSLSGALPLIFLYLARAA
jgi:hypothetical protein